MGMRISKAQQVPCSPPVLLNGTTAAPSVSLMDLGVPGSGIWEL